MAHGNVSDLVSLVLLAAAAQFLGFPDTLGQELGPFKAQVSDTQSDDMKAIIKLNGGLLLFIALLISGVSWNPINGKMSMMAGMITVGLRVYTVYPSVQNGGYEPRIFDVYAAALLLGSMHIGFFPSNPPVPKTDATKNNHGNWSDKVAMSILVASIACLAYPDHLFMELGPMKPQFSASSADLSSMIQLCGCLLLFSGMTFSGVKWNPNNGKMAGFGGFIASGYTAYSTFKSDSDVFVPRMFYVYAGLLFLGCVHIFFFPANPPLTKKAKKN